MDVLRNPKLWTFLRRYVSGIIVLRIVRAERKSTMARKPLNAEEIAELRSSPYVANIFSGRIYFTPEFKRVACGQLTIGKTMPHFMPCSLHSTQEISPNAWKSITRPNTEVGLILQRLNFLLSGVSVLQTIEFQTCQHFVAYLLRGFRQETLRIREWTGISQQLRPKLS